MQKDLTCKTRKYVFENLTYGLDTVYGDVVLIVKECHTSTTSPKPWSSFEMEYNSSHDLSYRCRDQGSIVDSV